MIGMMPSAVGAYTGLDLSLSSRELLNRALRTLTPQLSAEEMPDDLFSHTRLSDEGERGPAGGIGCASSLIRRRIIRHSRMVDLGQVLSLCRAERPR